jgi:small subunit ribosomal protein S17
VIELRKDIGIKGVTPPKETCSDRNCPFHGTLPVRGKVLEGEVISDKMEKTVTIRFERLYRVKKYERFEKRNTKFKAHNPPCISAKIGDFVRVAECRPLSKTKRFVVVSKVEKD